MIRPPAKTLVVGHPVVATPIMLASGLCLVAGFQTGTVLLVIIGIALIAAVSRAVQRASAYRTWKADWDGMGDSSAACTATPGRVAAVLLVAALMLVVYVRPSLVAYWTGFALGWLGRQHWLVAAIGFVIAAILFQFVRHWPRRAKPSKPVAVIAKRVLPVPSLADAYRTLPPYCQALLQGRS